MRDSIAIKTIKQEEENIIKLAHDMWECPETAYNEVNACAMTAKMLEEYDARRKVIVKGFNDLGLECREPKGAFYAFPCIKSTGLTSEEFCERLLQEKKVAVVPGTAFGDCGEGFVRVSYAYSIENIREALRRIRHYIENFEA